MKRYFFVLLMLHAVLASAQDDNQPVTHYLLNQFYPGKVYMKAGEPSAVSLNYNALTNEMVFDNNGKYMAIANPEMVDSVVINGRVFIPADNKFYEMLTHTPNPLCREYTCTIKSGEVTNGYGAVTNASAITSVKGISQSIMYNLVLPPEYKVTAKRTWWIKTGNGFRKVSNEQQLKKLFPDKKDQISEWVKKNNTNFSEQADMVLLVQQIDK